MAAVAVKRAGRWVGSEVSATGLVMKPVVQPAHGSALHSLGIRVL